MKTEPLILAMIVASGCAPGDGGPRDGTGRDAASARAEDDLAAAELERIVAGHSAYTTSATDWTHALADAASNTVLHRMSCGFALARALELGAADEKMSRSDPAFQRLHASALVQSGSVWEIQGEDWIKAVPATQCLLAARAVDEVLPPSERLSAAERDVLYGGAAALTSHLWVGGKLTLEHFESIQRDNAGNTQGEEMGWTASFMVHVEQLVPDEYFKYPKESREGLRDAAQSLVDAILERCSSAESCDRPFMPGADLVSNHQMLPHPVYTQSVFTSLGEIAGLYHQLGTPAERRIAFPPLSRVREVATAIDASLDEHFRLVGTYEFVDRKGNVVTHPDPGWPHDYEDGKYTVRDHLMPTRDLDAFNQVFDGSRNVLVSQLARGDRLWRYECDATASPPTCTEGRTTTLADYAGGLGFEPAFPTDRVDAIGQFFTPSFDLQTLVFRGDRVWHLREQADGSARGAVQAATVCEYMSAHVKDHDVYGPGCQAWMDSGCSGAAPAGCMATGDIESLSFVWDEKLQRMRSYLVAGGRIWQYRCDAFGHDCAAVPSSSSGTLCEQWTYVTEHARYGGGAACDEWIAERRDRADCASAGPAPAGCLPTTGIDAVSQTWDANPADPKLRSYVIAGGTMWAYFCRYGADGAIACEAQYDNDLARQWRAVAPSDASRQSQPEVITYGGVVDWGFDAALQNNAYAFLVRQYGDDEPVFRQRYERLLAEQQTRGLDDHPYFPPHYDPDEGTWSFTAPFAAFAPMRDGTSLAFTLQDGWRWRDGNKEAWNAASRPSLDDHLHSHAFFNSLATYNHASAYLLLASPGVLGVSSSR